MIDNEIRIRRAIDAFKSLLGQGKQAILASSFGKDSEACVGLFLNACCELMNEGTTLTQQFLVTSSTLVENPEVEILKQRKIKLLKAFCELRGIPLSIIETSPSLAQCWQVKVIGGKSLPTMVNSPQRQCSVDLKIAPSKSAVKQIKQQLPRSSHANLFTVLGSRNTESTVRAKNIKKFGGNDTQINYTADGQAFFYPVKHFLVDDIWYFLIKSGNSKGKSYLSYLPNHDETIELYKDSAGECVMLQPDTNEDGVIPSNHSACGARHGCWTCGAMGDGGDKSMEQLIAGNEERYGYLKPLSVIRNFMVESFKDLGKRRVVGRTIKNGHLKLAPDCFSASLCRDLLKACLSADYLEMMRAEAYQEARKYQIITMEQLFAIDWSWSVSGLFEQPFEALKVFEEVFIDNDLLLPEATTPAITKMPKPRYLPVSADWYGNTFAFSGFYNESQAVAGEESSCYSPMTITQKGRAKKVAQINTAEKLSVNLEPAYFVLEYELENLLTKRTSFKGSYAAQYYLSIGLIQIPRAMLTKYDEMLARGTLLAQMGLDGNVTLNDIETMGISEKEYKLKHGKKKVKPTERRKLASKPHTRDLQLALAF